MGLLFASRLRVGEAVRSGRRGVFSATRAAAFFVALALASGSVPASADPTWQVFLDGLRQRGYTDMALEYLDQMRSSPRCPPELEATIDYQAGITLILESRLAGQISVRERRLDEARDHLERFLEQHPEHAEADAARTQLANVLVQRGRLRMEARDRPGRSEEERERLAAEARASFEKAREAFQVLEARFVSVLRSLPELIGPRETALLETRKRGQEGLLDARVSLGEVALEIALTYPEGSEDRRTALRAAAEAYHEAYRRYGQMVGGLYARLQEGRCYRKLGERERAIEIFEEFSLLGESPEWVRLLKDQALAALLETLNEEGRFAETVGRFQAWESAARNANATSAEALALQYFAGEAALEQVRALTEGASERRDLLRRARGWLAAVSRVEGEHKRKADALLLDPLLVRGTPENDAEPATFAQARDRGREALDRMQAAEYRREVDSGRGEENELAELAAQRDAAREESIRYYRLAERLADASVPLEERNLVRYHLAYLYYVSGELYDAAVLGEHLARRHSTSNAARQAARIALACYVRLLNEAGDAATKAFARRRVVDLGEFAAARWPGDPEAEESYLTLIRVVLADGDLAAAHGYLAELPENSPRRGEGELIIGQALWADYVRSAVLPAEERPAQEDLDRLVTRAREALEGGVARMRRSVEAGGTISYTLAASVLALAQIEIGTGQPAAAAAWLDDPEIGAMTLVARQHPATREGNFREETHKAALRAYVAVQELDKAEAVMESLEAMVGERDDADASRTLTRIYIQLGRELQELLERLREERKTEELDQVTRGFELFLTRLSEREEGNTFNSLGWVAETFYSLGAAYDPGGAALPERARGYYERAAATYRRLLELADADPEFAPQEVALMGIQVRLARTMRRLGEFPEALALLVDVLVHRNMMVDAQVEAAYTYQAWGEQRPERFLQAINGGQRARRGDREENVVWGWARTAATVANNPRFSDIFHEARYNMAFCRMKYALSLSGDERTRTLRQAETDIAVIARLYPEMGGPAWEQKYDSLLRTIQQLRGTDAEGIRALRPAAADTAGG